MLENDSDFIHGILKQLSHGVKLKRVFKFNVLVAVVDKLSLPNPSLASGLIDKNKPLSLGSEGISIAVVNSKLAAPDLWKTNEISEDIENARVPQPGMLSFQLHPNAVPPGDRVKQAATRYTIDLPLANTTFQNGRSSTLIRQKWIINHEGNLNCERLEYVHRQSICFFTKVKIIPSAMKIEPMDYIHLSPFRRVKESVGNVIRSFENEEDENTPLVASSDLEHSITKLNGPRPSVWAEVVPSEEFLKDRYNAADFQTKLSRGLRLFNVLSGGGGYGQKRGLIALDPDLEPMMDSEKQSIPVSEEMPFGQLVRPGDYVRFIGLVDNGEPKYYGPRWSSEEAKFGVWRSLSLGRTPQVSDSGHVTTSKTLLRPIRAVQGHFGALSETTATITVDQQDPKNERGKAIVIDPANPDQKIVLDPKRFDLISRTRIPPGTILNHSFFFHQLLKFGDMWAMKQATLKPIDRVERKEKKRKKEDRVQLRKDWDESFDRPVSMEKSIEPKKEPMESPPDPSEPIEGVIELDEEFQENSPDSSEPIKWSTKLKKEFVERPSDPSEPFEGPHIKLIPSKEFEGPHVKLDLSDPSEPPIKFVSLEPAGPPIKLLASTPKRGLLESPDILRPKRVLESSDILRPENSQKRPDSPLRKKRRDKKARRMRLERRQQSPDSPGAKKKEWKKARMMKIARPEIERRIPLTE